LYFRSANYIYYFKCDQLFLIGKELHCTDDLKLYRADPNFHQIKRKHQIDCSIKIDQTHAMKPFTCPCPPEEPPWCKGKCCNGANCKPSSSGTIAIKNCVPDENTSITDMLMSFKTSVPSMPQDFNKNLTDLVLIVNAQNRTKVNKIEHQVSRKSTKINHLY